MCVRVLSRPVDDAFGLGGEGWLGLGWVGLVWFGLGFDGREVGR